MQRRAVQAEAVADAGLRLSNAAGRWLLLWSESGGPATISPAWVSASYGTRQPSQQAELAYAGDPLHYWALLPGVAVAQAPAHFGALRRVWDGLAPDIRQLLTG